MDSNRVLHTTNGVTHPAVSARIFREPYGCPVISTQTILDLAVPTWTPTLPPSRSPPPASLKRLRQADSTNTERIHIYPVVFVQGFIA
ncbi:hypothetical protein CEP54_002770 [Fusarium duplospermum]|uniref:Uncharacterized protein n=1 Tax=Fusarium duplospermum TaxID=1325734 RepID=A0A428QT58_9HYPO|nr:hypothetical protein CEP54_002770 [Fusarium duplospermum]